MTTNAVSAPPADAVNPMNFKELAGYTFPGAAVAWTRAQGTVAVAYTPISNVH